MAKQGPGFVTAALHVLAAVIPLLALLVGPVRGHGQSIPAAPGVAAPVTPAFAAGRIWSEVVPVPVGVSVRATRSHWVAGAAIGLVVGAGGTWLFTHHGDSTSLCDRSANQDALNARECAGIVVLGGIAGAAVGALIGSRVRSERRDVAPLERLRIGASPGGGVHLNVAFTPRF